MAVAKQTTLRKRIVLSGAGVHSNAPASLVIHPAAANSGITFLRTGLPGGRERRIQARYAHVSTTELCTVLGGGEESVSTVEHLMAAFSGLGVDNATVEGGAGNDTISTLTELVSLKSSLLNTGDGNDLVTLVEAGINSVSMDTATVNLGAGDDRLIMVRGTGTVDGGSGADVLQLKGASANFLFKSSGLSKLLIQDVTDGRTSLTVSNVEQFQFDDKSLTSSEALAQLGQTALPTLLNTSKTHSGETLTGYINGSAGHDIYEGASTSLSLAGIARAFVTDALGNSEIRASAQGSDWSLTGVLNSSFRLGDGNQTMAVEVVGNGYTRGIAGTSIEMGAGASLTEISLSTGSTADNRRQTGIESSSFKAGAGNDVLKVSVEDLTPGDSTENYLRGITGNLGGLGVDMGAGDDQVLIRIQHVEERDASGLDDTTLLMGDGNDTLSIESSNTGIFNARLETGAGNDSVAIAGDRYGVRYSNLLTGAGNDTISIHRNGFDHIIA
jgi:hypothetical protein